MMIEKTFMRREIEEVPYALKRLDDLSGGDIRLAAERMKKLQPSLIITVGRGSSDHAATYLKYAIEILANIPVSSLGPSVASIYNKSLRLDNCASLIISQSGKSPDILKTTEMLGRAGSENIAITNTKDSPIFGICKNVIDLNAGLEKSVAATKTFISSIVAGLWVLAYWLEDKRLIEALKVLPSQLDEAINCDWSSFEEYMEQKQTKSTLVLGRGLSYGITLEAALKLKEVCQIHAEAFSSAEVLHGPLSMVDDEFAVLAFVMGDKSKSSIESVVQNILNITSSIYITSRADKFSDKNKLPFVKTDHFLTDPISLILSFYVMVEKLAQRLGLNPDNPRNLKKVTQTI